jgi:hypothetical protein
MRVPVWFWSHIRDAPFLVATLIFCTFIVPTVIFRGLQRLRFLVRQRPQSHPTVREFSNIFHGWSSPPRAVQSKGPELALAPACKRFQPCRSS